MDSNKTVKNVCLRLENWLGQFLHSINSYTGWKQGKNWHLFCQKETRRKAPKGISLKVKEEPDINELLFFLALN